MIPANSRSKIVPTEFRNTVYIIAGQFIISTENRKIQPVFIIDPPIPFKTKIIKFQRNFRSDSFVQPLKSGMPKLSKKGTFPLGNGSFN